MLRQLADLAKLTDSDSRRDLMRAVADMFFDPSRDEVAAGEIRLFAEVASRVLAQMTEGDRAEFSGRAAQDSRTPRDLALALASDTVLVGAPVIKHSPALTDDDLISIAREKGLDHRIAISQRPHVGERVTDVLVDFEETEVMLSLMDNDTAKTSEASLKKIAARAETVVALRDKLVFRENTPDSVLRMILPLLGPDARGYAEYVLEQGGSGLSDFSNKAKAEMLARRAETARRRIEIKSLARDVTDKHLTVDAFIERIMVWHKPLDLALGLSLLSDLPESHVANAVVSTDGQSLALICKSLDVGLGHYLLIEALRRESVRLSTEVPAGTVSDYEALDKENAARTLRFIRTRAKLAAA
jgi:hypothetical protein